MLHKLKIVAVIIGAALVINAAVGFITRDSKLIRASAKISTGSAVGSGFYVEYGDRKLLVTAAHVCSGSLMVTDDAGGLDYIAAPTFISKTSDICVIVSPPRNPARNYLKVAVDFAEVGDKVTAIGHPGGDDAVTITSGYLLKRGVVPVESSLFDGKEGLFPCIPLSVLDGDNEEDGTGLGPLLRGEPLDDSCYTLRNSLDFSAEVATGSSGGALLNADQEVISVVTLAGVTSKIGGAPFQEEFFSALEEATTLQKQ